MEDGSLLLMLSSPYVIYNEQTLTYQHFCSYDSLAARAFKFATLINQSRFDYFWHQSEPVSLVRNFTSLASLEIAREHRGLTPHFSGGTSPPSREENSIVKIQYFVFAATSNPYCCFIVPKSNEMWHNNFIADWFPEDMFIAVVAGVNWKPCER